MNHVDVYYIDWKAKQLRFLETIPPSLADAWRPGSRSYMYMTPPHNHEECDLFPCVQDMWTVERNEQGVPVDEEVL